MRGGEPLVKKIGSYYPKLRGGVIEAGGGEEIGVLLPPGGGSGNEGSPGCRFAASRMGMKWTSAVILSVAKDLGGGAFVLADLPSPRSLAFARDDRLRGLCDPINSSDRRATPTEPRSTTKSSKSTPPRPRKSARRR